MITLACDLDVADPGWGRDLLERAARMLAEGREDGVFLDSAIGDAERGHFSLVALETSPVIEADELGVRVWNEAGAPMGLGAEADPWKVAAQTLSRDRRRRSVSPCGAALGWVGYLSYEAARLCDAEMPRRERELPFPLLRFDRVRVALRTQEGRVRLIAEGADQEEAQRRLDGWRARLRALPPIVVTRPPHLDLLERPDREAHRAALEAIRADIAQGRVYQICHTFPLWFARPRSLAPHLSWIRRHSPGDFSAWLRFGALEALSTSPEQFLRVEGRRVWTRPMKGTRPALAGQEEALARELAASEKDRAENLMIVDLLRNDLNRVCETGSVEVPSLFEVERYRTVLQMTSTVTGRLREDRGIFDLLRATFPPGSMTGAPKIEACHVIQELEPQPRGLYSGVLGWIGYEGNASFSVVIRTLQCWANVARWDVGGGIVWDSEPEAEWQEALGKAAVAFALAGESADSSLDGDPEERHEGSGESHEGSGESHEGSGESHEGSEERHEGSGESHEGSGESHEGSGESHEGSGES